MIKEIKGARASGCPIIFVRTQDQPDCARRVQLALCGETNNKPVVIHDCCRGFTAGNKQGTKIINEVLGDMSPTIMTEPQTALDAIRSAKDCIVICLGADRWMAEPRPAFAALLTRDTFKENGSSLVCLGSAYTVASELGADVVIVDDPPPDTEARSKIIDSIVEDANIKADQETRNVMLTYTRGLSAFAAEQTCALAVTKSGFDLSVAERSWREQIDATPGLRMLTDRPDPDSVAGLAAWTKHIERMSNGRQPPEAVVFIDEIEKSLAGSSGSSADSSGSSQQVLGRMLTEMENTGAQGSIMVGPPGVGKSLAAQVAGVVLGVPTIALNPSDLKGSLVGETERNATRTMAVIRALAGRAYWIATCNGVSSLPPELLRRFTDGVWMFDLPDDKELAAIWAVHLKARGFKPSDRWTNDKNWTGADVRNVCRAAWNANVSIAEIAQDHVPSSRASADIIERLRRAASGAYRSAQYAGPYQDPTTSQDVVTGSKPQRKFANKE